MCAGHGLLPAATNAQSVEKASEERGRTVTRSDIAAAINRRLPKLSQRAATQMLDCVLQEIAGALSREECVKLHEFGAFFVRERAAGRGRGPFTGESAAILGRKTLNFRPSVGLKEKVEKSPARGRRPRL
jgi:integration host factor subunit alpha